MTLKNEWTFRELKYVNTTVWFDDEISKEEALRRYNGGYYEDVYEEMGYTYSLEVIY